MIHGDFEAFSEINLRTVGSFRYAEDPSTEVLCFSWSYDDERKVHEWDPSMGLTDSIEELFQRVEDGEEFSAHNVQMEFNMWNEVLPRHFKRKIPRLRAKQLTCTAARAAMCSLPRSLEGAGAALDCKIQKDKRGSYLLKLFSQPRKPTKKDPRTRIMPSDAPELFRELKQYCSTDVRSEREIHNVLPVLPPFEVTAFQHDLQMNRRGIPIDVPTIRKAITVVAELEERAKKRVNELTRGINPGQRDRLIEWLEEQGLEMENLQAETVKKMLEKKKLDPKIRELLELRVEASKVSTKKLKSMLRVAMKDARARGMLLYYGAHTGRAAGKIIQPQNFIRGLPDAKEQRQLMDWVFRLLKAGADADVFEMMFKNPLTSIAQCMRGFIKAKPGKRIIVIDYAQIEARILVWLAGQEDAIADYLRFDKGKGHDAYVLMAAFLWSIEPDEVSKDQRRIAKNLILGCGFGLGWKKFIDYCAKAGVIVDEDMAKRGVNAFRDKYYKVVEYWGDVERCAIQAVRKPGRRVHLGVISFYCEEDGSFLKIRLPSGRDLYYPEPQIDLVKNKFRKGQMKEQLSFMDQKKKFWVRVGTYGGRLVENIDQAIARDIMENGVEEAERGGYPIILIVHDELLCEIETGIGSLEELSDLACKRKRWMEGLPIKASGFECQRYWKGE